MGVCRCSSDLQRIYRVSRERRCWRASSAAGGLRIVVVGNVPGLTVEAANQAALGAGAKIVGSTAFKLAAERLGEIESLRPDMILLTGGVDGGDTETILHNARHAGAVGALDADRRRRQSSGGARGFTILQERGKEVRRVDNVMPKTGTLEVESAREEIRQLFMAAHHSRQGSRSGQRVRRRGFADADGGARRRPAGRGRYGRGKRLGRYARRRRRRRDDRCSFDRLRSSGGRKCDCPGPGRILRQADRRRRSGDSLQCGDHSQPCRPRQA